MKPVHIIDDRELPTSVSRPPPTYQGGQIRRRWRVAGRVGLCRLVAVSKNQNGSKGFENEAVVSLWPNSTSV
jgi:hypothetical protein